MELLDFLPSPTTTWGTAAFMHVAQNGRLGILGRQMRKREGRSCSREAYRNYYAWLIMTKFCALRPTPFEASSMCLTTSVSLHQSSCDVRAVACVVQPSIILQGICLRSRTVPVSSPPCSIVRCGCNHIYASQSPKYRPWTFKLGVIPDLGHRHLGNTKTFGSG